MSAHPRKKLTLCLLVLRKEIGYTNVKERTVVTNREGNGFAILLRSKQDHFVEPVLKPVFRSLVFLFVHSFFIALNDMKSIARHDVFDLKD